MVAMKLLQILVAVAVAMLFLATPFMVDTAAEILGAIGEYEDRFREKQRTAEFSRQAQEALKKLCQRN